MLGPEDSHDQDPTENQRTSSADDGGPAEHGGPAAGAGPAVHTPPYGAPGAEPYSTPYHGYGSGAPSGMAGSAEPAGPQGPQGPLGPYPPFHPYGSAWPQGPTPPWVMAPEGVGRPKRSRVAVAGGLAAGILAAAAVGGVIGHSILQPVSSSSGRSPSGSSVPRGGGGSGALPSGGSSGSSSGSGPSDSSSIASHVDPGVVDIDTVIDYGAAEGAGTGMVLTSNGEVLTNNHVIEGATSISVTDVGNHKTYSATVVGYDKTNDVAVLQLTNASGLKTVSIATSAASSGAQVVAVGNAGGAGGTPSYAGGTITATGQAITAQDDLTGTSEHLSGMLETNADIVAGDSGGPLVNSAGRVVGMDTAGSGTFQFAQSSGSQGFAVPIAKAMRIAGDIESGTTTSTVHIGQTAFLGVQISPSGAGSGAGAGGFGGFFGTGPSGSGSSNVRGAAISGVVSGSPASGAGLGAGDVITSVGGHAVTSNTDLQTVLVHDETPGETVKVQYTSPSGARHTVTLILASGPPA
jgi:S1-C subfamily serine protease